MIFALNWDRMWHLILVEWSYSCLVVNQKYLYDKICLNKSHVFKDVVLSPSNICNYATINKQFTCKQMKKKFIANTKYKKEDVCIKIKQFPFQT